ncbi:MAG: molybdopterin-guanine dinucleotide biosynthesis protein A [Alphaproteobacteria bacterium]
MLPIRLTAALLLSLVLAGPAAAQGDDKVKTDRHALYYYPETTSAETYVARARTLDDASREKRIGFVVAHTLGQAQRPYPPRYALYAKGDEAEKLLLIGLYDETFLTLYRARAVLAQMTALARSSDLFRTLAVEDYFTFFDLLKMLGFRQITISDGDTYTHQVTIE